MYACIYTVPYLSLNVNRPWGIPGCNLGILRIQTRNQDARVSMAAKRRNTLKPDDSFLYFVLDQLAGMSNVSCRAMFGGFGLYRDELFFGIIHNGRLYFKTNENTRTVYIQQGMKPFQPNRSQTLKNYYEVPPEIIDDPEYLVGWAKNAVSCRSS